VAPEPARRRFLTAEWRLLALVNYAVEPALLAPCAPRGTELDLRDGRALLSLVGFRFVRTRLLGVPIPWHQHFDEVNLRFYVRREVRGEVRHGVTFIREIVPRRAIARVARAVYNEPYLALPMRHATPAIPVTTPAPVRYEWRSASGWHHLALTATGGAERPAEGSEPGFLTDRPWGYTRQRDGGTIEYLVEHPRWRVWRGEHADVGGAMSALYGDAFGEVLARAPDSAFLADGSAVTVYRPVRI
jgi:uncharacterized protein YqjF (DUF2071 family)